MIFKKSVTEKVTAKIAPITRKLMNISLRMLGYPSQILRITESNETLMGDVDYTYTSQIVNNVIIDLPFSEVDMLTTKDSSSQAGEAFSLTDLLTIDMYIPYEGDKDQDAIQIDENDIIVLVVFDGYGNKIPIRFQGPRLIAGMIGRYEGLRKYELTLVRGKMEDAIEQQIDDYIESLGEPEIEATSPSNGATGVGTDTDIELTFNLSMNESSVESAISIIPSITYITAWDSNSKILTITPDSNLDPSTEYTVSVSTDAKTEANIPMQEEYTFNFNTGLV